MLPGGAAATAEAEQRVQRAAAGVALRVAVRAATVAGRATEAAVAGAAQTSKDGHERRVVKRCRRFAARAAARLILRGAATRIVRRRTMSACERCGGCTTSGREWCGKVHDVGMQTVWEGARRPHVNSVGGHTTA
eukprot:240340-Chlamydomonas_euryale.AAC.1